MSGGEHAFLGYILLGTVVAFFGVALPGYWLIQKLWPESGWNLGGSVSTAAIRPLDLVVVGGLVTMYVGVWKTAPGMAERIAESTPSSIIGGSLTMLLMAGLVPLLLFWRTNVAEYFGLRWMEWRWVFLIAPVFVVGMFVLNAGLFFTGWPKWVVERFGGGSQDLVKLLVETKDLQLVAAAVFAAVIVAPIAEEVIFRGYIYPVVKRFSEKGFAALFSALLFGVIHFNLASFPALVVMGLVLVALYEVTGSIWPSIACHALFNAISMTFILLSRFVPAS
ncbi:CPBP family intramembrane metalloprotease [Akkermansiaceae bacterium]|nr:CPBP family intramembrane metalloprotease [Akkermansiaceae bacterium]MDB4319343.1 CPBP family intramembrane metalloprotease [bacterium]